MIKKIINTVLLPACLLFVATGCTAWLTVKPEGEVVLEDFWTSESSVESVLASCYRGLTEDAIINRMIVWGELRSDNLVNSGTASYDMQKILDGDITSSNSYASWGSFYSVINYCNTVLYYAPDVVKRDLNFTAGDLQRVQAEAKTLRALCYFYLVRAFQEVPWVTTASVDDTQDYNYPKATEAAVLDSLITDLNQVRSWATTNYGDPDMNKGRITQNSVNTLLADIYLWKNDYNNCITACNRVLQDTTLKLINENYFYPFVFGSGNSAESIFELQFNDNVQINNPVRTLYGYSTDPFGDLTFPPTLAFNANEMVAGLYSPFAYKIASTSTIESPDDLRAKDSYYLYGGRYFIYKYVGYGRTSGSTGSLNYSLRSTTPNWIIYRLSDVILMKAEALAQRGSSNDLDAAIDLVNVTYMRSNMLESPLDRSSYTTKEEVQKLVLRERQREFLFEGKRWFDLVRLARRDGTTSNMNTYVEAKTSSAGASLGAPVLNAMYMPVSKTEMESNPNMTQNPFYEESGSTSTR
jgi:starch-binding outer membrane protein, SusD/RagB family